jgi:RimJ/RimL family protein N-acetyltransferase
MSFAIRPATLDDAAALIAYIQELAREPEIDILFEPNEFNATVDEERDWLRHILEADNSTYLVAERDGVLVGTLSAEGGPYRAVRHVVNLGISVRRDHRNQGIGHALLAAALAWAAGTGIVTRVELSVITRNARAIHLYEKFGFQTEGRRIAHVRRLGNYYDTLLMAKRLPEPTLP